jgi:hypothetical protein
MDCIIEKIKVKEVEWWVYLMKKHTKN